MSISGSSTVTSLREQEANQSEKGLNTALFGYDMITYKPCSPCCETTQKANMKTEHKQFINLFFFFFVLVLSRNLPSSSHKQINFNLVGNEDSQHLFFYSLSQPVEQRNDSLQGLK